MAAYESNNYRKRQAGKLAKFLSTSQGFKRDSKRKTNCPTYPFCSLSKIPKLATWSTSTDMKNLFHVRLYSRFEGIKSNLRRKKLYATNHQFNFLEGSLSNRDNVKFSNIMIFLQDWLFHSHINRTRVIKLVK